MPRYICTGARSFAMSGRARVGSGRRRRPTTTCCTCARGAIAFCRCGSRWVTARSRWVGSPTWREVTTGYWRANARTDCARPPAPSPPIYPGSPNSTTRGGWWPTTRPAMWWCTPPTSCTPPPTTSTRVAGSGSRPTSGTNGALIRSTGAGRSTGTTRTGCSPLGVAAVRSVTPRADPGKSVIISAETTIGGLCGPGRCRTDRSGEMPDTVLVFGSASAGLGCGVDADAEGIDEGCAVVDLEAAVVAEQADGDAGPAAVEGEVGVGVADGAAAVDAAFEAALGVGVGGGEFDGGQVDAEFGLVDLGGEVLPDRFVGAGGVVVGAVGLEQLLRGGEADRWAVVDQPGVLGRVLAFELADRLGVVGTGVDELDARDADLTFEGHGHAVQAAGEVQPVVREQLPGQPVGGDRGPQRGPSSLTRRCQAGVGGQQEPGMVIDDVDHPERVPVGQPMLGRVDVPQVVAVRAYEPLPPAGRFTTPRPRVDQAAAHQHLMHRGHRRQRRPPVAGQH